MSRRAKGKNGEDAVRKHAVRKHCVAYRAASYNGKPTPWVFPERGHFRGRGGVLHLVVAGGDPLEPALALVG